MSVELFLLSSLYVTGNVTRYFVESFTLRKGGALKNGTEVKVLKDTADKFMKLSVENYEGNAPVYVGGNGAMVPIGGGISTVQKRVLEGVLTHPRELSKFHYIVPELNNVWQSKKFWCKKFWITTPDDLTNYLNTNKIPSHIAPFQIPLFVYEMNLTQGTPVYTLRNPPYSVAGTNKNAVIRQSLMMKRIITMPMIVAAVTMGISSYYLESEWRRYKNWKTYKNPSITPCLFNFLKGHSYLGGLV